MGQFEFIHISWYALHVIELVIVRSVKMNHYQKFFPVLQLFRLSNYPGLPLLSPSFFTAIFVVA